MTAISDQDISDAVARAKDDIHPVGTPVEDADQFIRLVSEISTRATLDLLGVRTGHMNRDIVVEGLNFPVVFAEWAQQFILKTHFDHVLAAILYLREREGQTAFSTTDILRMYDRARWKKPANMADIFAKGAERLYFTEVEDATSEDGLKMWSMTRTGYSYLISLKEET